MTVKPDIFDGIIKHSIKSVFDGINEQTEKFRKSFDLLRRFRTRHSQKLVQSVSKIQILGMRGAASLIDIYVPTRFSERIRRDIFVEDIDDILDINALRSEKASEIELLHLLKEGESILIQGGPGSGKTTFISAYVMALLGKCPPINGKLQERFLPLHFVLRDSPEPADDLRNLVKQYLRDLDEDEAYPFVERMLNNGGACLIFDGLDEIPPQNQILWKKSIDKLRKLYPKILIVLTCRSGSLGVDFATFKYFEILPFTKRDSKQFIESWFGESKEEIAASLHKDLRDHPRINDLTETPLLLSLLCNLYENDLELSSNRTDLYSRCIEVLMVRWDTSRGFKRTTKFQELSLSKRRRLFCLVGYHLSESRYMLLSEVGASVIVGNYIERYDLEADQAAEVLSELESHHGLLVKPAANYWCFAHKSLQDFFAAEHIRNNASHIQFLSDNWSDRSKWDVLTFVATLLENGDEFIAALMRLADPGNLTSFPSLGKRIGGVILLVKCLNQGVSLSKETRSKTYNFIAYVIERTTFSLSKTDVYPYGFIVEKELYISYYYYKGKQRSSTNKAFHPLANLVKEVSHMKGKGLDEIFAEWTEKSEGISAKLLLAAASFHRNPETMYLVYEQLSSSRGSKIYGKKIKEISDQLKQFIIK
jgi:predicted NACHT family NTPase